MKTYDLIIVGGGTAGMLCALNCKKKGIENILIIEKDGTLGGALNLLNFPLECNEYKSSNEYKQDLINKISELDVDIQLNTLVININENGNLVCVSPTNGVEELNAKAIVLANGSKEKALNTLELDGDRCSGVISLKTAKKILNMDSVVPGKNIVIYGNENLSFIESDLKRKNANIVALVENNINNDNFDLTNSVYNGYKVTTLKGKDRLSSITISNGTEEKEIFCDCLIFAQGLLSDGLVSFRSNIALNPETTGPKVNDFFETSRKNVFACGDGIYIHTSLQQLEKESNLMTDTLVQAIK